MRIGKNPNKDINLQETDYTHQIVIPLYIPNFEGYFKDSLKIFQLCLSSLTKTSHNKTFISVINNGSCNEVRSFLNEKIKDRIIHEVVHTNNIGKNNAIIKGVIGHNFRIITIADSDVLFLNNWQNETIKIFNAFPKAGVVGIVPQFGIFNSNSWNVLFDNFFSKKMQFTIVKNPNALKLFYNSIGWDTNYNKNYLEKHLTLRSDNNLTAVIGSGHFVATYKREVLNLSPNEYISKPLSSKYDNLLLDKPILFKDGWRLTTDENFAYHMGNTLEDWMFKEVNENYIKTEGIELNNTNILKKSKLKYLIKCVVFRKIFKIKIIYKWFLSYKNLPKKMISKY